MKSTNISPMSPSSLQEKEFTAQTVHPAWRALIQYCAELDHGEIEVLKIQNGLPVLAEVIRKKVKFTT